LQRQVGDFDGQMPIAGLSKIFALESTEKFQRFRGLMVSATIEVDWLNQFERTRLCPSQRSDLQYRQCGCQQVVTKTRFAPATGISRANCSSSFRRANSESRWIALSTSASPHVTTFRLQNSGPARAQADSAHLTRPTAWRFGHGAGNLPFNHRCTHRTLVGERQPAPRLRLSVHVAGWPDDGRWWDRTRFV